MAVSVKDRMAAIISGRSSPRLPQLPGVANAQGIMAAEADRVNKINETKRIGESVGSIDASKTTTDGVPQTIARLNAQYPGATINMPGVPSAPAKPSGGVSMRLGDAFANPNAIPSNFGNVAQPKPTMRLGAALNAPATAPLTRTVTLNENRKLLGIMSPGNTERRMKQQAETVPAARAIGALGAGGKGGVGEGGVAARLMKMFPSAKP